MVDIDALSIDDLDAAAAAFALLIEQGLEDVIEDVLAAAGLTTADLDSLSPDSVDLIAALWAGLVSSTLMPALAASMQEAAVETAAALTRALGVEMPFLNEPLDTQRYLAQAENRLRGIGDELWFNARAAVSDGLAAGESIPDIAERVREAAEVTKPRARVIARTESHGARNAVNARTVRRVDAAFGVPGAIRREWQAALDERTRQTHRSADGQVVGLDEPFRVGNASLDFPGDPQGPAAEVISCRCTTITVIDTDMLDLAESSTTITLNAASYQEDESMPWSIVEGDERCEFDEFAVVKDADGSLAGCHETRADAEAQVTALNIAEAGEETAEVETEAVSAAALGERSTVPWSGVLVVEGSPTGDGRQFATGALSWPEIGSTASLEIPLGWKYERAHGGVDTDKVVVVGRIDSIERRGNALHGRGVIDLDSPMGREAARLMGTREDPGFLAGVSIDADSPDDPRGLEIEYVFPAECTLDSDGRPVVDAESDIDMSCMVPEMEIYHSARIRAATLVDIPAYVEARLYLDSDAPGADASEPGSSEVVTASGFTMRIPDLPPVAWFSEPDEDPDIGAITVTDQGRIFGYLAPKNVAHRGIRDKRVEVPMRNVDYGIWMNRATLADDSNGGFTRVATGPITMDCGHAPADSRVVGAARRQHYDNSCSVVATVRAGENDRGVWIAGSLLPDVTVEQVRRMMACQLSGDWGPHREKPGQRELAAALLVPVPGFPKRTFSSVSVKDGAIDRVSVPLRFGVQAQENLAAFGTKAAADRIAASIGRDPAAHVHRFASRRKR